MSKSNDKIQANPDENTISPLRTLKAGLAGSIAGVSARLVVYPLDTLKARLQVQGAFQTTLPRQELTTLATAVQVVRAEGVRALYSGFSAVVVGSIPGNMAYFAGYELGRAVLHGRAASHADTPGSPSDHAESTAGDGLEEHAGGRPVLSPLARDMAVGAVAQLVGGVAFTPMDIIKERLQVQAVAGGAYTYSGAAHALLSLVRAGGGASLFRGYWATNAVWLPWNILYVGGYEACKRQAAAVRSQRVDELPPWAVGTCSAVSASAAAVVTHPADVVKTRLQVLPTAQGSARTSALHLAQGMWAREGPRVFWRGLTARVLTLAPGTALSWMIFEPVKDALLQS